MLKKRLAAATIVLLVFAMGLWTGWHKDMISARLSRWHTDLTHTEQLSASPSPAPLSLPEFPVQAMAPTPTALPSFADQLLREGIELRDYRSDPTNAIERFKEALDSEPNNASVLAELAKTYDVTQLYDRANEVWRKLQEMGPSAGSAYQLADQRLKHGAPGPPAAPMPTLPAVASRPPATQALRAGRDAGVAAPDFSSSELASQVHEDTPRETPVDLAKYAIKPREDEIDQVAPLPTSTASEKSSPPTGATPAEAGASAETADSQRGGRLIVLRAPNFGSNFALNIKIDGKTAANIVQGRRYDEFLPPGRHMLTVSAVPNYPTSTVLNVQDGQTYVFTAIRQNPDSVVLVPSPQGRGEPH